MDTFAPTVSPSYNSTKSKEYRVLKAQFGDGYVQEAGDGINTTQTTFDLTWENLTTAEANYIETFMDTQSGYKRFLYAFPAGSAALKWVCQKITRAPVDFNCDTINCTLERRFDP